MSWAITGIGMQTSVGDTPDACYEAFCNAQSGNAPVRIFDRDRYNISRAYEIDDREGGKDRKGRAGEWLVHVIKQAVEQAGLSSEERQAAPVLVGTGLRELRGLELWWTGQAGRFDAEELHFGPSVRAGIGTKAQIVTVSNACSAGSFTLGMAADMLELGQADAVIVAGSDALTESMFGFTDRASKPGIEHVQPFDRDRKGVLLGEGAAALVLEPVERATKKGRTPLALLRGVGMNCDAHHETAPSLEGVSESMRDAHRRSGVGPKDIDLVMAHGTATMLNDGNEIQAFRQVFGEHASKPVITALKSMTGHTSGASGLMGVVTAILAMQRGRVPPTVGLKNPIEEAVDLDIVKGAARDAEIELAQVDAFGFGGVNAVAILERVSS